MVHLECSPGLAGDPLVGLNYAAGADVASGDGGWLLNVSVAAFQAGDVRLEERLGGAVGGEVRGNEAAEDVAGDLVRGPAGGDGDPLGGLDELAGIVGGGIVAGDGDAAMIPTVVGPAEQEPCAVGIDEAGGAVVG